MDARPPEIASGRGAAARARLRAVATKVGQAGELPQRMLHRWTALTDLIAGEAVEHVAETADGTYSAINSTGVPVQFSVSLGADKRCARVVGEVGRPGLSMYERLLGGGCQTRSVLGLLALSASIPPMNRLLAGLLPPDKEAMRGWTGALWCGATVAPDGSAHVRVYLNQRWGDVAARVDRLSHAINFVAGATNTERWRRASMWLGDELMPYGVALDVGADGVHSVKIYAAARNSQTDSVFRYVNSAVGESDAALCAALIRQCEGLGGWSRPRMVMPCLEFTRGRDAHAKVDLALCTLPSSDIELDAMIRSTLEMLELSSAPYIAMLAAMSSRPLDGAAVRRLQYLSVGVNAAARQLTVYFSPDLDSAPSDSEASECM